MVQGTVQHLLVVVTWRDAFAGNPFEKRLGCSEDPVLAASMFFGRVPVSVFAERGKGFLI